MSIGSIRDKIKQNQRFDLCSTKVEPQVEIISYCLILNHYHLILKQIQDDGIPEFIRKLSGGYTMYFNLKYNRSGALFQGRYKSGHLDTDENFMEKLIYVSCNAAIHNLVNDPSRYKWCGYEKLLTKNWLSRDFIDIEDYKKFEQDVIIDMRENKKVMKSINRYYD